MKGGIALEIKNMIKKLVLGAMFLSIGIVLPFFTGQIPQIGSMLLPMHIPVFLCGLICGWKYGMAIGFILPLMRSALFIMPPMFPDAVAMAFELSVYGLVVGFLYEKARWHCIKSLLRCMAAAMICGRIVWGIAMALLLGIGNEGFGFEAFIAGAFINALPGIILQFILIPGIMLALGKTHLMHFSKK
ncbi:MAG: ECF transporter S component [Oscillospiraceae bacterium]|nr:ECF transporter S component [Oscillospiraceae bacterium]